MALSLDHQYTEDLPFEIRVLVLLDLDSLQSLYALIRASPCFLRAFLTSKAKILTSFVRHHHHPEILADALAASDESIVARDAPIEERIRRVGDHYERHRQAGNPQAAIPLPLLQHVCRLSQTVDWHTVDFLRECRNTLTSLKSASFAFYGLPAEIRDDSFLSDSERWRIKRAFYRFHLFTQVFVQRDSDGTVSQNGDLCTTVVEQFTSLFWPWELEELVSVRDYFRARLWTSLQTLEDQFVDAFVAAVSPLIAHLCPAVHDFESYSRYGHWDGFVFPEVQEAMYYRLPDQPSDEPIDPPCNRELAVHHFIKELDVDGEYCFFGLRHKARHFELIDGLGFQNLKDLRQVFQASEFEQLQEIWQNRKRPRSLVYGAVAFSATPGDCRGPPHGTGWGPFLREMELLAGHDLQKPSEGWLWAYPPAMLPPAWHKTWNARSLNILRRSGYVFWDKCRLERSPIPMLEYTTHETVHGVLVSLLINGNRSYDEYSDYYNSYGRLKRFISAENRIRHRLGVPLNKDRR